MRAISGKYNDSVGNLFLGIDKDSGTVNPNIFERENWLTILLGVLLILEGTKQLVRWTQMVVSQPSFGFFPDDLTQIIAACNKVLASMDTAKKKGCFTDYHQENELK